jgi:hypothetical protein
LGAKRHNGHVIRVRESVDDSIHLVWKLGVKFKKRSPVVTVTPRSDCGIIRVELDWRVRP